jgi:CheY-like chemotaxis protein
MGALRDEGNLSQSNRTADCGGWEKEAAMARAQRSESCILIVEDDVEMRESLGEILQGEGYRVAGAANGLEALDRLRRGEPPCIILLDLMMPVMSGWEFREVQRRDPRLAEIPVAIITGVRNAVDQMMTLGAVGYFQKPLDLNALLQTVAQHC